MQVVSYQQPTPADCESESFGYSFFFFFFFTLVTGPRRSLSLKLDIHSVRPYASTPLGT